MRLIDRNEIYRRFFDGGNGIARIHVYDIDTIPDVDAAPVVHGRWIVHPDDWRFILVCSNCGRMMPDYRTGKPPYCTCGAKMDLQEDSE